MTPTPSPQSTAEPSVEQRAREMVERLKQAAKAEFEFYQRTTCGCIAAERYMWDCRKHGVSAGETKK